jgi:hypothetical protein
MAVLAYSLGMNKLRRSRSDERSELVDWRRQYLTAVGVPVELASLVAADLLWDLHALLQLLDRRCPVDLAARILAPSDHERDRQ